MGTSPSGLTPTQVNSWPIKTTPLAVSGDWGEAPSGGYDQAQNLLDLALERFNVSYDAENKRREEMLLDHQFSCGQQWDSAIRLNRGNRPSLTINRIPGFVDHVVNNMRQTRPGIKIDPIGDGADEEIAEVRQGLIRHIEVNSKADIAYDTGFRNMCIGGLGWMRIVDDWAAPDSFDQDLFVRWVMNPFSVYSDPAAAMPDWSDMRYAFVVEDLTRGEFIARFGKDKNAGAGGYFQSIGDNAPYWAPGGKIRIAEYFHVEMEDDTLIEMEDGTTILLSKLEGASMEKLDDGRVALIIGGFDQPYNRFRKCKIPVVHWDLISAMDVLQSRIWKGKKIPLIPIIGNQTELDGERIIVGMVRYAREPQRLYNYMYSSFVETVALAPRNQFIAEVDQIAEFRDSWETANTSPQAVLVYRMRTTGENGGGNALPPPQRQSATVDLGAFVQGLQMADQNLKSVFQIFEASLGQRGPQESGLAINARKVESETGTYNWGDNFIRSLRSLGEQLNELLPFYYNNPGRVVHLIGVDERPKRVVLNQAFQEQGQDKFYDLSKGRFNAVVISAGESFLTRRKDAAKHMTEIVKAYPDLMGIAGDLVIKEMDFPGKDAFAARMEKALPPGLKDPDQNAPPIPPEVKQAMDQMQQMIQELSQELKVATDKNEQEKTKQFYETLRTEMTNESNRILALIKTGHEEAKFLGEQQFMEAQRLQALAEPGLTAAAASAAKSPATSAGPPTGGG